MKQEAHLVIFVHRYVWKSYHVTFLSHVFSENKFDIAVKKKAYLSLSGCKQPNGTKIIIPSAGPASAKFFFHVVHWFEI